MQTPHGYLPDRPFVMIDREVLDLDLDTYEFRLYAHIRMREGQESACWESIDKIGKRCGFSANTVKKSLKGLVHRGLVKVTTRLKADGSPDTSILVTFQNRSAGGGGSRADPGWVTSLPRGGSRADPGVGHELTQGGSRRAYELDPSERDPSEIDPKEDINLPTPRVGGSPNPHDDVVLPDIPPLDELRALTTRWMDYAKTQAPWLNPRHDRYLCNLARLMRSRSLTPKAIEALLDFVSHDAFWQKNAISPEGLLKKSANGLQKIDNVLLAMKNDKRSISRSIDQQLADEGYKPVF